MTRFYLQAGICLTLTFLAACQGRSGPTVLSDEDDEGPAFAGQRPFDSDEVGCADKSDCGIGEACFEGTCILDSCPVEYPKAPPMGTIFKFLADDELLLLTDGAAVGYQAIDKGFRPEGGRLAIDPNATDVSGGPVFNHRPNTLVVADGTKRLRLVTQGSPDTVLTLPFAVMHTETADLDGDGYAEIVAMGSAGSVLCDPKDEQECRQIPLGEPLSEKVDPESSVVDQGTPGSEASGNAKGLDVTIADIDGDGLDEAVLVSATEVMVYNAVTDRALTFKERGGSVVTAGDLDGDGADEIVLGSGTDSITVVKATTSGLTVLDEEKRSFRDLAAMDLDDDGKSDLVVLSAAGATVYRGSEAGLSEWYTAPTSATESFRRVAIMDVDGDSAIATFQYGPEVFNGPLVPSVVLIYPPYWSSYSEGDDAFVGWGVAETERAEQKDSLSFETKMQIGVETTLGIPFISKLIGSPKVAPGLIQTTKASVKKGFSVESRRYIRHKLFPDPVNQGVDNGGVVVGTSCYAYYEYRLSDPFEKTGPRTSDILPMVQPLESKTTVMSVKRYNAIAGIIGAPEITIPYRTGDPTSYASEYEDLAGNPVDPGDFVFEPQVFDTTDISLINWRLSLQEETSEEHEMSSGVGAVLEIKDINPFAGVLGGALAGGLMRGAIGTATAKGMFKQDIGEALRRTGRTPLAATEKLSEGSSFAAKTAPQTEIRSATSPMAFIGPQAAAVGVGAALLGSKLFFKYQTVANQGVSYKMSYGNRTLFYGVVPNIPDRPETPEDETAVYGYEFSPFVYRHYYVDPLGQTQYVTVINYRVRMRDDTR